MGALSRLAIAAIVIAAPTMFLEWTFAPGVTNAVVYKTTGVKNWPRTRWP